jgi:cytochrome P450
LLDVLLESADSGDRLTPEELVAMVVNLLFGALDTTRGALSMMLALLVARPELAAALRADPSVIAGAVEEMLRFDPPVGEISRVAAADLEIAGHRVAAGELVAMSVLAANRDPARFAQPETVDFERFSARESPSILSFGRGIHHCLGSALARLELRTALHVILDRWTHLELAGPPPAYVPFLRVRCMDALPLVVSSGT